jgi:hypothetical protein
MTAIQKKIAYSFNTFFLNFVTDLKESNTDLKEIIRRDYKVFDKFSIEHIENMCPQYCEKPTVKTFDECLDIRPFKGETTVNDIASLIEETDLDTLKSYITIFQIMCNMYSNESLREQETLNVVLRKIQELRERNNDISFDDIIDDALRTMLQELDGYFGSASTIKIDLKDIHSASGPSGASGPEETFKMFENSMIGSLAKEISEEINLKDLNIKDPSELLKLENLTCPDNVLGQIVSKVSSKIHNKISSGSLNQADLVGEAMNIMSMFQKKDAPGADLFNNIMSQMKSATGGRGQPGSTKVNRPKPSKKRK